MYDKKYWAFEGYADSLIFGPLGTIWKFLLWRKGAKGEPFMI